MMGWLPDLPDMRDFTLQSAAVKDGMKLYAAKIQKGANAEPTGQKDLRGFCSPIEDQGAIGSCTAHAVVGVLEYMMRRGGEDDLDGSRMFLYKTTRNLSGWKGDTGAYIRNVIKAAVAFGIPPEEYWPYEKRLLDVEPTPFVYAYAGDFKAVNYVRLDDVGISGRDLRGRIKHALHADISVVCGFPVYSSVTTGPDIPYPSGKDKLQGGHAVMLVGFDDARKFMSANGVTQAGAFIVRNSWGQEWGEHGYGYLPYAYVDNGLVMDCWIITKWDWLSQKPFAEDVRANQGGNMRNSVRLNKRQAKGRKSRRK